MPGGDHCVAFGCTNRRGSKPHLSFHHFPNDSGLCARWVQAVKREHFKPTANSVLCSEHFDSKSYFTSLGEDDGHDARKRPRFLKPGSLPTIFPHLPPPPEPRPAYADRLTAGRARALEVERKKTLPPPGASKVEWQLQQDVKRKDDLVKQLESQVAALQIEVKLLKSQLFRYENIRGNEQEMEFLTGLNTTTWDILWVLLDVSHANVLSVKASASESQGRKIAKGSGRKSVLSLEDQLLLTLMRFRLGRLQEELAYSFGVSDGTVSNVLKMWTSYMYLRLASLPLWPDWSAVASSMPESFKKSFPDTFIILDATELRCEIPSSLSLQSQLYSRYKSHTTLKGLVGIAPNGCFTFISQLYTGSISDKQLVIESGILSLLESVPPGKRVMADRGFEIQDLLVKPGLILNIPPFKGSQPFMPKQDVVKTQKIASVRIHIERAIGRVKSRFHILDRDIPLSLFGTINQIWTICCMLTNFSGPLIAEERHASV